MNIAGQEIEYTATFVPQSKSRNAGEKTPSINWAVRIETKRGLIVTDYMQGIGHIPNHNALGKRTIFVAEREKVASEEGKWFPNENSTFHKRPLPAPELKDVLYCLLTDADAIDAADFEEWARDFGYDTDSISAEKTYQACVATGLKMRSMFGDDGLKAMREALNDS